MAKTFNTSGTIEAVSRNGKAFKIGEDWFSVYKAAQLGDAQKGDDVEFDYVEKKVGGTVFLNVEGNVNIVGGGSSEPEERPARSARGGGSAPARTARSEAPARSGTGSPANDPRQRSIVRQNSLTQANNLLMAMARMGTLEGGPEELAELAVQLAKDYFEPYSMVEDA